MRNAVTIVAIGSLALIAYLIYTKNKGYQSFLAANTDNDELLSYLGTFSQVKAGSDALNEYEHLRDDGGLDQLAVHVLEWWNGTNGN